MGLRGVGAPWANGRPGAQHSAHSEHNGSSRNYDDSGRKAGSVEDFKYSSAMTSSGIVWTAEQIDSYITLPKKAVAGGIMKYDGLPGAKARADLIEYLATLK